MKSSRSARRLRGTALVGALLCASLSACAPQLPEFGTPPPPAPPPVLPEVRLISAIEANGCEITADNSGQILLAANMTQSEMSQISEGLAASGRLVLTDRQTVRAVTERCV